MSAVRLNVHTGRALRGSVEQGLQVRRLQQKTAEGEKNDDKHRGNTERDHNDDMYTLNFANIGFGNSSTALTLSFKQMYALAPDLNESHIKDESETFALKILPDMLVFQESYNPSETNPLNTAVFRAAKAHSLIQERSGGKYTPNIIQYGGAKLVKDKDRQQRLSGIWEERVTMDLMHYFIMYEEYAKARFKAEIIARIEKEVNAGLNFLHTLGIAHNQIAPSNVGVIGENILDPQTRIVLMSVHSCALFDQALPEATDAVFAGAVDWTRKHPPHRVSSRKNDEEDLKKLKEWLDITVNKP